MTRQTPPPGETRGARFKRLAVPRVTRVLETLRVLGNLSNRSLYDYSADEVRRIFSVLEDKTAVTKAKFEPKSAEKEEFRFDKD